MSVVSNYVIYVHFEFEVKHFIRKRYQILLVGCRSRRDKFKEGKKLDKKCPTRACRQKLRCREPNRILQKVLTRVFRKSRKLRRLVRQAIS